MYSSYEEEEDYSYDLGWDYDRSASQFNDAPPVDFDAIFNDDTPNNDPPSPPPQIADDDANIALSTSINQSREFIQQTLGISLRDLHRHHVPGFVILRLEDFPTIRNVSQLNRVIPHLIIGPPDDSFLANHPDFRNCYETLFIRFPQS